MRILVRTVMGIALFAAALPAHADVLTFTGSVTGLSAFVGVDATCPSPLQFRTTIDPLTTTGTSSFGDFTYRTSTCLSAGGLLSAGSFTIDFGADQFSGTFDGGSTPTDVAGISNTAWLFTVLDGTGRFAGASGTFDGTGTTDSRTSPSQVLINFSGNILAPAVPEPASWALMLIGFGAIGAALRRTGKRPISKAA